MSTQTARRPPVLEMTEEEFDRWCGEDIRAEYVHGKVVLMAPVSLVHLRIGQFLSELLLRYLRLRPTGTLLGPEFQVRLRGRLRRVPDLLYVANEHSERIGPMLLEGAPDAAWEIVSQDSVERDWREKYLEYQEAGVREYWVVDPLSRNARVYRLVEGVYQAADAADGVLRSSVIPGLWLREDWLWQNPLPDPELCLREIGVEF